jgi:hypothetical protein
MKNVLVLIVIFGFGELTFGQPYSRELNTPLASHRSGYKEKWVVTGSSGLEKNLTRVNPGNPPGPALILLPVLFFIAGTAATFDKGIDSSGAIVFYSISISTGVYAYVKLHKARKRRY